MRMMVIMMVMMAATTTESTISKATNNLNNIKSMCEKTNANRIKLNLLTIFSIFSSTNYRLQKKHTTLPPSSTHAFDEWVSERVSEQTWQHRYKQQQANQTKPKPHHRHHLAKFLACFSVEVSCFGKMSIMIVVGSVLHCVHTSHRHVQLSRVKWNSFKKITALQCKSVVRLNSTRYRTQTITKQKTGQFWCLTKKV